MMIIEMSWKRDYGDGKPTDDMVLWIDGKPTNNYVRDCCGFKSVFVMGEEVAMANTFKEAKEIMLAQLMI